MKGRALRLCILSDSAARHTLRWSSWFAERGHGTHVVSLNPCRLPGQQATEVHCIWEPYFGNVALERVLKVPIIVSRLRRLLKDIRPDLIHAHSAGGYAWLAMLSGFRPYVVTPWGTDLLVDAKDSRANRWLTERALRRAAVVTTDGFHMVDVLRGFGVEEKRVFVHMFGTDVDRFSPGHEPEERRVLRAGEGPLVISTRTPNPVHDVGTFVRAIPSILKRVPEAVFVVVGDGADLPKLERMVLDMGVAASTRFTRMVDEERMVRLLRAADVYVSTSLMDAGLAGSTAEAMATALAVVQTKNGDNAYWTPNGEGGFLIPTGEPDAVADAVCRLLLDPELRLSMGTRNRSIIKSKYNIDIEMSRVESEYRRVIGDDRVG